MKQSKKNLFIFPAVMLLSVTLAACGENENESAGQEEEQEPTTISVLIDNNVVPDGIEAVAEAVEEKYNISLEIDMRPGGSEGDNIVNTRLATGDMTDIMWYNSGSLFKALNPEEYFYDLSDEDFIDTLDEAYIETVEVDGAVYGVPSHSAAAGGFLYNKNVYEELGLETPRTWDELMENNEIINEAGKTPVVASFADTASSQIILLSDYYNVHSQLPDFADEYTHNEASFSDTPLALRGFEKMQELHEAGHYNSEETSTTPEEGMRMLAEGEAAHYPLLTYSLPAIEANHPEAIDNIGFFGTPGDDPDDHGMTLWMPQSFYLNKDSEHIDEAKQFLEFFVSPEGLEIYMDVMKAEGPYVIEGIELPDDAYPAVQDMVSYLDEGRAVPALEFLSPLKGPNLEQILVEVGMGMRTAEEGAESYDRDVVRQAEQLNLEGWD